MRRHPFATLLLHLVLIALAVVCLLPFAWLVLTALTPKGDLGSGLGWDRLTSLSPGNLLTLFRTQPMWAWLANSLTLACAQTVLTVVLSCLGGYALAKHRFAGRRAVLWLLLLTMMLPAQALLPASYELMYHLGWLGSAKAIILPGAASAFGILLFRGAFREVPDELLQAGRIDGAGELRLWWDVAVPCVRPMIGAYTLLVFTGAWNSFIWPQVILSDTASYTLTVGAAALAGSGEYQTDYGVVMAATVVGIVPVAVLFAVLQRDFVAGLTSGAVKG